MNQKEAYLQRNIREYYSEGNNVLGRGSYNTAVSIFFKALAVLADFIILADEGFIPKSHTERFRILKTRYPEIYSVLDKDFPSYQQSYEVIMTKETAEAIKEDVRKLAQKIGFKLD